MSVAYDLAYNMLFHDKLTLKIGNFNVMSNISSIFSKPAGQFVHVEESKETENEWKKRFQITIDFIYNLDFDILAIQEATPDFYNMILDVLDENVYFFLYAEKENLLTIIKKYICVKEPLENIITEKFPYSKLSSFQILTTSNISINIVNVHLNGDPAKHFERIQILKTLASPNTIIIGDFNESVTSLLNDEVLRLFLIHNNFKLENQDDKMTSYSRYIIRGGNVLGLKPQEEQWEAVDNVLYGSMFILIDIQIFPENGLKGKQVPYLPLTHIPPYKYTRNFSNYGWSSDHTCNMYKILL